MDNKNRIDQLGVNKFGKNIRKSPLPHPNNSFANSARPQSQPQVYNINKNDFRNIVQQLTGSPARDPVPRPPINSPKPQSQRLQKIRPPPLTPIPRPPVPIHNPGSGSVGPPMGPHAHYSNNNAFVRPPMPPQYPAPGGNVAESPVSLYMRYLQNSIVDSGPRPHPQFSPGAPGLLPNPPSHPPAPPPGPQLTSPRMWGPPPLLPSPSSQFLLPSPTSQFLLPSPSGYLNMMSPRSPYPPLLSPGYQFPPPLSPTFGFPPMRENGILGPGPQPPVSPGISFPVSPAGFFPVSSPRWRDQKS